MNSVNIALIFGSIGENDCYTLIYYIAVIMIYADVSAGE